MERIDVEGFFWLAEKPNNKVAGRLRFDATTGAQLSLIGSFCELSGCSSIEPSRIHGLAGKGPIMLDGCLRVNQTVDGCGIVREQYYAPVVLYGGNSSGANFADGEPLEFSAVRLWLGHLEYWTGTPSAKVNFDSDEDGFKGTRVTCALLEKSEAVTDFGKLELCHQVGNRSDGSPSETVIKQSRSFCLQFRKPASLESIQEVCSSLRSLVTVGLDASVPITVVLLHRPTHTVTECPALVLENPRSIQLYFEFQGADVKSLENGQVPSELFTFEDIGGICGIARWLEVARDFRPAIALLVSHWRIPRLYMENRFFNLAAAAETLERIRISKPGRNADVDLLDALRKLAGESGDAFRNLVSDIDSWAKTVVRTRNQDVVHRGLRKDADGAQLRWLSESLYYLVVLWLLKECRVLEGVRTKIQSHPKFVLLSERLKGAY